MLALVTLGTGAIGPEVYALAAATLVLAIGSLAIGALLLGRRGRLPAAGVIAFETWSAVLAAGLSVGAAAIHFAAIGAQFGESPAYGVAFTALAWFQVGWAVVYVARPRRALATLALWVNVGGLILWALSRAVGVPTGPDAGAIAPPGAFELLADGLQLALIGILAWTLEASDRFRPGLAPSSAVTYIGSALLAVVVLTSTVLAGTGGNSGAGAGGEPGASGDTAADGHLHGSPIASPEPSAGAGESASPGASAEPPALSSPVAQPGAIVFGSGLDLTGALQDATTTIRSGQKTTWLAEFREPPNTPTLRFMIFQVLPDGRELEHWRQDISLADPGGRQLIAMADLSIYVHGGAGSYRMRYFRGDTLLAEGAFEFTP